MILAKRLDLDGANITHCLGAVVHDSMGRCQATKADLDKR